MRRSTELTVAWLGVLWLFNALLFVTLAWVSVWTVHGQMLDTVALYGNSLGRRTVDGPLDAALGAISLASIILVLTVIGGVSLARRRVPLAIMAAVVVVGSTVTAALLKQAIHRPWLGVDPERLSAGNSLPSGHAAAAAAFAIGLTLVVPPRVRGLVSVLGATYAAVVGVATLSSGWHRPSDVVAAYFVVGGWAALAGLVLVWTQRSTAVVTPRERAERSLAAALALGSFFAVIGLAMLFYVAQRMSDPVQRMENSLLRTGYLGSAVTVTGAAYLMMAVVLVSVHRVVPHGQTGRAPAGALGIAPGADGSAATGGAGPSADP